MLFFFFIAPFVIPSHVHITLYISPGVHNIKGIMNSWYHILPMAAIHLTVYTTIIRTCNDDVDYPTTMIYSFLSHSWLITEGGYNWYNLKMGATIVCSCWECHQLPLNNLSLLSASYNYNYISTWSPSNATGIRTHKALQ